MGREEADGFHRAVKFEETSPTIGTMVYLGQHVGFVFSLDVRDQCVDAQVVKVQAGQLKRNWEGGYSSNIFNHLVKYVDFRGSPSGSQNLATDSTGQSAVERMIDRWVELLKVSGQSLLKDRPESLPPRSA